MGAFFSMLLGIPGLLKALWQGAIVGGAYAKGRSDGRTGVKLEQAEATNAALQTQRKTAGDIVSMSPEERRKRLRRWADDGRQG